LTSVAFNFFDNIHALGDVAKDAVLAIQPVGFDSAQEKLAAVGIRARVGHRKNPWTGVLELEVFVGKLLAVDGFPTSSVLAGKVATLAHELRDDTVERGSFVPEALFTGAQGAEVFRGLWDHVGAEGHFDATQGLAVGSDVEETDWVTHDVEIGGLRLRCLLLQCVCACLNCERGRDARRY